MSKSSFAKVWLADPAVFPIIGVIGGAMALCGGASLRYLVKSPDVQWNKDHRSQTIRENTDEAIKWQSHKPKFAYMHSNPINTNSSMVKNSRTLSRRNTKEAYQTVGLATSI